MPQARRKTPFSGKAKKNQLQAKKQNKNVLINRPQGSDGIDLLNFQPGFSKSRSGPAAGRRDDRNRYALKFYRESDEELNLKKQDAMKSLNPVTPADMEIDPSIYFPKVVSFPQRPPWNYDLTPAQLETQEQRYFHEYITSLEKSEYWRDMSYFELNLETWRQLWRVLEMCDILLFVVDIRYCGCMFPPSLYEHITKLNKQMILVLNKIDLVESSVVAAWKDYFTRVFPQLRVVYFTCCPGYNLRGGTADKAGLQIRRRKGRQRMCAEGATKILEACKDLVEGAVSLQSWETKIKEETNVQFDDEQPILADNTTIIQKPDTSYYEHERYKDGVLTIGCVGQPNVGKSSLLNAIMGRKVVSVSRTPGHTKHFQTIFLTPQVRLCDCPGLVFPSTVPRPIQILMGSYPIAQLREPYTTIRYLAERLDLPTLLRMEHPEKDDEWSPRDICDGWAKKRGYLTAKAARLDTYRAANAILRMALDGKICLFLRPPGYTKNKDKWENSPEIKYIKWVQALTSDEQEVQNVISDSELSDNDDDKQKGDHSLTDDDDDDEEDESEDEKAVAAMANKFAGLISGSDDDD